MEGRDILRLKSLRKLVYEHLHQAINSGDLEPGSFIDQKKLAAELGISRQPLRDALIQLELEGFVTVLPRRGVQVRCLTLDDIRHLYQVIGALESDVLMHATVSVGEAQAREMRTFNEAMVEAIEAGDFDTYYELNLAFHDVFLNTSDNPLLLQTVRICKQRLYDFPRERRFHREWEISSTGEHAHIIDLIERSRHHEAAEYLRDEHWSFAVQRPYIRAYYHMDAPVSHPEPTGLVFDVQRFSVHDGPGIRTTVFLKGCPLACRWCHNPEGMRTAPEILVTPDRCIACGACVEACPHDLPSGIAGGWAASKDLCQACGLCAEACPTGARRLAGREMTVEQLVDEVTRDRVFYDRSGGGVTFSGGEPLSQADFVLACLRDLKARGVHTTVDTCGLVDRGALLEAAALADLFLFDIKHADEASHAEWAGAPNDRILANLEALARVHDAIWVRVPVVPGVNDDAANLRRTAALAASLPGVLRVNLLPYHELGEDKRERVGVPGASFATDPPPQDRMRDIATIFEEAGLLTVIGG